MEHSLIGPQPPDSYIDNGCGPKTWLGLAKRIVPDGMRRFLVGRRFDFTPACRVHDWHWTLAARGEMSYVLADAYLFVNLTICLLNQGAGWCRAMVYPALYWLGVRIGAVSKLRRRGDE